MRRLVLSSALLAMALCAYIASPFWSAWTLREAVKRGDVATLEQKVHWESVRNSVRSSLNEQADAAPEGDARPSLWQRAKSAVKAAAVDRFVDRYVTPQGLPQLLTYRQTFQRGSLAKSAPSPAEEESWSERLSDFYRRLKRAEFQSPTRVEIEVADRTVSGRHYVSVLELIGLEWKLTSLRIITVGTQGLAALR